MTTYEIDYSLEQMRENEKRMRARAEFKYYDRVPVAFCLEPRYYKDFFGMPLSEYYKDAKTQLHHMLTFHKFMLENIPCDTQTSPVITISPYFENVKQASAFGCEVVFPYNETLHGIPYMKDPSEIQSFMIPEPDAGLWGTNIQWWQEMSELIKDIRVKFRGTEGKLVMGAISPGGLSPHMVAVDMAGTELYAWMLEEPELYAELLEKICAGMIGSEELARKIDGIHRGGFGMADDASPILSADMYKAQVVPYTRRMYDTFGKGLRFGRGMHICGDATHLLDALTDDLGITSFDSFGYMIPLDKVADKLGGKALLLGNVDPMMVKGATAAKVKEVCLKTLKSLAPCGGFTLSDGANICPGTPLENLAAFTEAAKEYQVPEHLLYNFDA